MTEKPKELNYSPIFAKISKYIADLAQLVEQLFCKQ